MLKLLLPVVLFSLSSVNTHASDIRKENLGNVEGVIATAHGYWKGDQIFFRHDESLYKIMLSAYTNTGAFDADMPLQVNMSGTKSTSCSTYFLDKDYSYDEMKAFAEQYSRSKVRLLNVHQVYLNNKRLQCTFTDFDVLATRQELAEQREKEKQRVIQEREGFSFEGDLDVQVSYLTLRFRGVNTPRVLDGEITTETLHQYCGNTISYTQVMKKEELVEIRQGLKQSGGKAKLNKLKISDGKCTVEEIVPVR